MRIPDQSIQMQFRSVRRRFVARYRRAVGPIEVTALLNVILLIGMFHYASSDFVLQPGIRVALPEAPFVDGVLYGARVLTISQEGLVFFNDERVQLEQLGHELRRTAGSGTQTPLLIEADQGTPYGILMQVYALARESGLHEVVLATRPSPVGP